MRGRVSTNDCYQIIPCIIKFTSHGCTLSAFWITDFGGQQSGFSIPFVISEKMGGSNRADLPADWDVGVASNLVYDCQSTD